MKIEILERENVPDAIKYPIRVILTAENVDDKMMLGLIEYAQKEKLRENE